MTGRDAPTLVCAQQPTVPRQSGGRAAAGGRVHWDAVLLALQQAITFAELLVEHVSQVCLPKPTDTLSPIS